MSFFFFVLCLLFIGTARSQVGDDVPLVPVELSALLDLFNATGCRSGVCARALPNASCEQILPRFAGSSALYCTNGSATHLAYFGLSPILTGSLPESIGQLSMLTFLSFSANRLNGSFPSAFSRLSRLTVFVSIGNATDPLSGFTGSMPDLTALTQLTHIALGFTGLTGPLALPSPCSLFTSLTIPGNQLANLPTNIGTCSNLRLLSASRNPLSTIPSEIGALTALASLSLGPASAVTSLPSQMAQLSALTSLSITGMSFTSLPAIDRWTRLTVLQINSNFLSSASFLTALTALTTCRIDENCFACDSLELSRRTMCNCTTARIDCPLTTTTTTMVDSTTSLGASLGATTSASTEIVMATTNTPILLTPASNQPLPSPAPSTTPQIETATSSSTSTTTTTSSAVSLSSSSVTPTTATFLNSVPNDSSAMIGMIGGVVGGVLGLCFLALVTAFICWRRRSRPVPPTSSPVVSHDDNYAVIKIAQPSDNYQIGHLGTKEDDDTVYDIVPAEGIHVKDIGVGTVYSNL